MPHLELTRLRSPLLAFLSVAFAAMLIDVLCGSACGVYFRSAPPPFDPAYLSKFHSRLASFEQMCNSGKVNEKTLVAVIGMSTVGTDFDPEILSANDPDRRQWLVLGGQGRNFTLLEIYSRPLIQSTVKPGLVILGIHEFMLRGDERDDEDAPIALGEHLRHLHLGLAARDVSWLYRNRPRLVDCVKLRMDGASNWVRVAFGLPMDRWYAPDDDPWIRKRGDDFFVGRRGSQEWLDKMWTLYIRELTPQQFEGHNGQGEALVRLVAKLRQRGSRVVCVLLPESSQLRPLLPARAAEGFRAAVMAAGAPRQLQVIDLRGAIADQFFFDYMHLNADGRRRFSMELPARVR